MGKDIPKLLVFVSVAAGLGIILLVGLLSGLVARPKNCIPVDTKNMTTTTQNPLSTQPSGTTRTTSSFIINNRTLPATTSRPFNDRTTTPMFQFRLGESVVPTKYDLLLKFYFDPYAKNEKITPTQFNGELNITLNVENPTNKFEIHVDVELILESQNLILQDLSSNQNVAIKRSGYLPNQLYEIETDELKVGNYRLWAQFKGTSKNTGLYQANYMEKELPRTLLATRFLPTYARTVFPCFDEPSFKAEYEITIEHPDRSIALSNFPSASPVQFSEAGKNRLRTKFQKTFPMSSYLVSFAVVPDDYQYRMIKALGNLEIRVYGRKSLIEDNEAEYALFVAQNVIEYYADYFGIKEAIPPKIDLLAVPDFYVDSSKNWGLSAFHEEFLLYSEKINSVSDRNLIAKMIANEFAHYWTGGYVTPYWWDDLWLNEGFSTFFEYQSLGEIYKEWNLNDEFINDHMIPIMWDDGFVSSRPIKIEVALPVDIAFVYEQLTLSKSAAVIRMLKSIVGDQKFKEYIRKYLSSSPYGLVSTSSFYENFNLTENIGTTTEDFVDRWLLQKNYPELTVLVENLSGKTRVNFIQSRFLLSSVQEEDPDLITSPYGYKWEIYIECKAGGQYDGSQPQHNQGNTREFKFFLSQEKDFYDLDRVYSWVKCNKDFNGFYVTDYRSELFDAFESVLLEKMDTFSIGDRSNLIHNAFELAFLGSKSYAIPNLLSNYLTEKENSFIPLKTFIWHINKIATIIEHRSSFRSLRGFVIEMLSEVISRLDIDLWDNAGGNQAILLKTELIEFQCRMQSANCLNKATEWFETIPDDYFVSPDLYSNPIPPDYRPLVYKYHMQNTYDLFDWIRMYEFYETTNNVREREYAIEALGNTRSSFLFDLYLGNLLIDNLGGIKEDDIFNVLLSVAKNPNGRYFAWYFMREYWNYFSIRFGQKRQFSMVIKKLSESFDNVVLLEEIDFFIETTYDENEDLRFKALDLVINNLNWVSFKEDDFVKYFFGRN